MKNREERKTAQRQPSDMSHQGENYRKSSKRELNDEESTINPVSNCQNVVKYLPG